MFTCEKWFTGYNFGIENGAESKFGTNEELIVLKIWKNKYWVNKSRDMWPFFYEKSLIVDKLVILVWIQAMIFFTFILNSSNTLHLKWLYSALQ